MKKTSMPSNSGNSEAADEVFDEDFINRNPEIKEFLKSVDIFLQITSDSLTVASNLEESIRNVSSENDSLMWALNSSNENRRLEKIRKMAEKPNYFSDPLLKELMEVIDKFEELRKKQEKELEILNKKKEKQRGDITDQERAAKEQEAYKAGMIKKVWGAMGFTTQLIYELLLGLATGNLTGMAHLISSRDRQKLVDIESTLEKLWKAKSETESLREYVLSIQTKVVVVHEFKNIHNNVMALKHKLNGLSKSAVDAIQYKDEEGIYNQIVGKIKEKGKQIESDSVELEKEVRVWKKDVTAAKDEVKNNYLIGSMKKLGS